MQGVGHLSPDSRGLPLRRSVLLLRDLSVILILLTLLTSLGCQSTHAVTMGTDGAPQYQQAKVVYEVSHERVDVETEPAVKLAYAKSHPLKAAIESRRASREIVEPARPVSRLTIEYPHPDGDPELAQAVLEVPNDDETFQQVAATDLPRHELDLLLINLANGGAFDTEQRPTGTTEVEIEIDGHGIARRWTSEPRLDRLAAAAYDAR